MKQSLTPELSYAIQALPGLFIVIGEGGVLLGCSGDFENAVSEVRIGEQIAAIAPEILAKTTVLRMESGLGDLTLEALTQHSRLESLGGIASGVAHDINNIVTGVLGHVNYLRVILGADGKHVESLKTIEEGAKRAASLSQQVLKFSKAEELVPTKVDAREVVRSTLALLKAALPPSCQLTCSLPTGVCAILAMETQLSQIVMNLVVNARDAVGQNGQIEVVVSSISDLEELKLAFKGADLSSNSYIRILVADNGHGMPDEVKRRMFEPYFSTKKSNGTGLGLATVNQIVKQFGGAIVVNSSVGRGTTIAVYLPEMVQETGSKSAKTGAKGSSVIGGTERILVIDDEYSVRNVLCLSLEHLGYEVVVASGGAEALEIYRSTPNPFDLVLLDMLMPEMPGERVFAALQELDPDVAVMVVSGFAAATSVQSVLDGGGLDYLPKPFTIEELARKVRGCLD